MKGKEVLILDLAAEYPGDLLGDTLIDDHSQELKKTINLILQENEGLRPLVRVSHPNYIEKVNTLLSSSSVEVIFDGQRLATYDEKSPLNEKKRVFRSIEIFQRMEKDSGNTFNASPITLWGALPKIGISWVNKDHSLVEIYQVEGGGTSKIDSVFLNGPLGECHAWSEVKGKTPRDFPFPIKTIHFFEEGDEVTKSKTWKEFFIEDSCRHCLPCYYKRISLKNNPVVFENFEQYDCHLPSLYQRYEREKKSSTEGAAS